MEHLEATQSATRTRDYGTIKKASVYLRRGERLEHEDMGKIMPGRIQVIAMRKWNSRQGNWYCTTTNTNDRRLAEYVDDEPDVIIHAPEEPTHNPDNGGRFRQCVTTQSQKG